MAESEQQRGSQGGFRIGRVLPKAQALGQVASWSLALHLCKLGVLASLCPGLEGVATIAAWCVRVPPSDPPALRFLESGLGMGFTSEPTEVLQSDSASKSLS